MTERFELVVRGGTVADGAQTYRADLGIRDGRIAAIGQGLGPAERTIEAAGLLVLPGGIDSHCHIEQDNPGSPPCADDFATATLAAAFGGTTTVIPFAMTRRGDSIAEVTRDYRGKADRKSVVDFGIHVVVTGPLTASDEAVIAGLVGDGYNSIKLFTTYEGYKLDDTEVMATLALAHRLGALPIMHCETDAIVLARTRAILAAGHTAPRWHAEARPILAEREAVHRAVAMAESVGTPLVVLHVTGREPLEQIRWARARGLPVAGETCPHYLLLTAADLERPGIEPYGLLCTPPLRTAADQEALWQGIRDGSIGIVSSDHAPQRFPLADGPRDAVPEGGFDRHQRGLPGLELRLPLLFSEGVAKGRITLDELVRVTAGNPARHYGLYPRKGAICIGADADLALWDPERHTRISYAMLHDRTGYTPYEGLELTGWPVVTIGRGEVICEHGRAHGRPGRGRFVPGGRVTGGAFGPVARSSAGGVS